MGDHNVNRMVDWGGARLNGNLPRKLLCVIFTPQGSIYMYDTEDPMVTQRWGRAVQQLQSRGSQKVWKPRAVRTSEVVLPPVGSHHIHMATLGSMR